MDLGDVRLGWRRLAVLWLAAINLRITVLALPPLLPQVRQAFDLGATELAAVTTLPVLLLAIGAPLGAAVITRVGARGTLLVGLAVIGAASALRGLAPGVGVLFGLTFAMGVAIAAVQPAMPALVQRWLPRSAGFATATYTNGLLVGEVLAASLTLSLVLPATGGWRAALAVWSLPAAAAVLLVGLVRDRTGAGPASAQAAPARADPALRWWPDWGSRETWRLGLLQGAGSVVYFATNTFLPTYLHAIGTPGLVGPSLTTLNAAQVPASLLLAVLPTSWVTGPVLVALLGVLGLAGVLLVLGAHGAVILVGAALVGFVSAAGLIIALTLPVVAGRDAHRVSAGMFTIGYGLAFLLPLLGGVVWDVSGVPVLAFLPALLSAAAFLALAPTMRGRSPT